MQIDSVDLTQAVKQVLDASSVSVSLASQGGNSRLYRVCVDETYFALKAYAPNRQDVTASLIEIESKALEFFASANIGYTPGIVFSAPDQSFLIMEWCDGQVIGGTANDEDIDASLCFLAKIHDNLSGAENYNFPKAKEACLSAVEVIRQIEFRIQELEDNASEEKKLLAFLEKDIIPFLRDSIRKLEMFYTEQGLAITEEIPLDKQTLVPSDFGFHNAIKSNSGDIKFIDFEYFGWDDPVKLTADFMLHPGVSLSGALKQRFLEGVVNIYQNDDTFLGRWDVLRDVYCIRWTLIMLNEFLPAKWEAKKFANRHQSWEEAKVVQLNKAIQYFTEVRET